MLFDTVILQNKTHIHVHFLSAAIHLTKSEIWGFSQNEYYFKDSLQFFYVSNRSR